MAPLIDIHPLHQLHNPHQVFSAPTWWPFEALHQKPSPGLQKSYRISCLQLDTLTDAGLQRLHLLCLCQGQSQTGNRRLIPTVWWGSPQSSPGLSWPALSALHCISFPFSMHPPYPCTEADNETALCQRVPCNRKWLNLRGHRSCRRPYHRLLILSPPLCLMGPVLSRLHLRDSFLKTIPLVFGIGGPSTDGSLGPSQTKHWEVFRSALIRPSILTLCSLTSPLHHSSPICHQQHQCSLQ